MTEKGPNGARKSVDIDTHRDASYLKNALLNGWRISAPKTYSDWHRPRAPSEATLRLHGKWETLFRGAAKVSSSECHKARIDVIYLHRVGGRLVRDVPNLRVAMVASVRAPVGVPLYDQVRTEFALLEPAVRLPAARLPAV